MTVANLYGYRRQSLWPGLMYVHSRILTLRITKSVLITNNSVSTSHKTNYFSVTKTKELIFLAELVIILLKFTIIYFNSTVTTARFYNVESCIVFNQNVILISQILYMLQRRLHFRSSNVLYNPVSV
jgi:hypothetical protein